MNTKYSQKRIGLWYYSPASVNALLPLALPLRQAGYDIKEYVLSDFAEGLTGKPQIPVTEAIGQLLQDNLDMIIYNTGSGSDVERNIPNYVEGQGIPSVSILDTFWEDGTGYPSRFPKEPTDIICVTEKNRQQLVEQLGKSAYTIHALGNPHFDRLQNYSVTTEVPEGQPSVTFLSQCDSGGTYTEPTAPICQEALLSLVDLQRAGVIGEIKVYKHPRETNHFFRKIGLIEEATNHFEDMIEQDIIISCGSTPHYEANLLGKATITYKQGKDMKKAIQGKEYDTALDFEKGTKAVDRIVSWIHKNL